MRHILILMVALLMAGSAWGDAAPDAVSYGSVGVVYKMCDAQPAAAEGDCTRGGDEIVTNVAGFSELTFYSVQSTATTFVCNIMSNDTGHDAAVTEGEGQQVNSTSISETVESLTLTGPFMHVWVTCPTIDDNSVTINMLAKR